ncbi:MAG: hypothetical protein Q7J38_00410 [Gallionella sp.]|nr:hypothetical protein [Gallionella sp.]
MTRFLPEGSEIVLYRAREGDFFAEASLFGAYYYCNAICTRSGRCLQLPATVMHDCLSNNPDFAMKWIATLSGNLRRQRAAQERLATKVRQYQIGIMISQFPDLFEPESQPNQNTVSG